MARKVHFQINRYYTIEKRDDEHVLTTTDARERAFDMFMAELNDKHTNFTLFQRKLLRERLKPDFEMGSSDDANEVIEE